MKRKILSGTMALVLILSLLPSTALASPLTSKSSDPIMASLGVGNTFVTDGIQFNVLSESLDTGTVEVVFNSYSGDISIPSAVTYSGITYTVTGIGDNAFYECSGLTSVIIPDGVTSIGKYAFGFCRGLKSVTIPDGVADIGEGAFFACSSLINAEIPDSVTKLGKSAFDGCSSLTSLTISKNITTIEDTVFWSCSSLRSVTIPEKVTSIGKTAFFQCSALTNVTIPGSVESIGDYAFSGCSKLSNAHFEATPPAVGADIFTNTASGFKIYYNFGAAGWTNPWNGYATAGVVSVSFDSQGGSTIASKLVEVGTKAVEPEAPAKKSYAFAGWYKEPSCETPWNFGSDTVTENITLYAKWSPFVDTTAPVVLGVSPFGTDAFTSGNIVITFSEAMDTAVTGTVSLGDESTTLTGGSWSADARTYTIPYSGLSYGTAYMAAISGFQDEAGNPMVKYSEHRFTTMATAMVTVDITGHIVGNLDSEIDAYMADHGISDYSSIKALRVSDGEIHTIDKTWLYNIGLLGMGGSLKIIDFSGTAFTGAELPSYMFGQSTAVETIILPESVTAIQSYAFNNCTSLKSINLPSRLTMINNAFTGCSSLLDLYSNSVKPPKPAYIGKVAAGAALHVPSGFESIWDAADYDPDNWKYFDLLIEPHPPALDIWPERTSDSTANILVRSSEPGSCYYQVVKSGDPEPSIDTSGTGTAFDDSNNLNIDLTGLEPGAYKIYAKGKDLRGNISELAVGDLEAYVTVTKVEGVTPNGSGASRNGNLLIKFSKAMDTSIKGAVSLDRGKTFLTSGGWSGSTVYTVPYSGLAYSTQYTVTISGFIDEAGNIIKTDSTHKFTTEAKSNGGSNGSGSGKNPEENKNTGAGQTFTDVGIGSWFFENVRFVSERGLMSGMGNGEFRPAGSMTRSMIVTVLFRLSGESGNYANAFSDVAPGSWYEKAAAWAAENGIAGGVGNSSFAPKQMLTREQLAVMLYNYAKYKGLKTAETGSGVLDGFTDTDRVSAWAEGAMKWAVSTGVITGDGARLNPKDSASRAEVAAMLQRFIEKMSV